MKHGIIGDNIKAFLGGYAGSFFVFFKPILLDTSSGAGQGFLLVAAIWFLKLLGLGVISLVTGACTALGADLVKNWSGYSKLKDRLYGRNKKDNQGDTGESGSKAA
jgi:hypothetical protein